LYRLYLDHPEGIGLSFLCDYRDELNNIYKEISSIGDLEEMKAKN